MLVVGLQRLSGAARAALPEVLDLVICNSDFLVQMLINGLTAVGRNYCACQNCCVVLEYVYIVSSSSGVELNG